MKNRLLSLNTVHEIGGWAILALKKRSRWKNTYFSMFLRVECGSRRHNFVSQKQPKPRFHRSPPPAGVRSEATVGRARGVENERFALKTMNKVSGFIILALKRRVR